MNGADGPARLSDVVDAQMSSGAFASLVFLDATTGRVERDENAFVTSLVVHHLQEIALGDSNAGLHLVIERGLDFVETCRVGPSDPLQSKGWGTKTDGSFRFYPPADQPGWMQVRLSPDIDDTVLALSVLLDAGRIVPRTVRDIVDFVIDPHRAHSSARRAHFPWAVTGSALTWIDPKAATNPVDCTVNANLAALLARLGHTDHPAYVAAVATVVRGVEWAGDSAQLARLITPYYPDPVELGDAVLRAYRAGVSAFGAVLENLADLKWASSAGASTLRQNAVCSSADGRVIWHAPVLQAVRAIAAHSHRPPSAAAKNRSLEHANHEVRPKEKAL